MDLKEIRKEIDATDDEILRLFLKRMDLCVGVAKYKKENNMQVFPVSYTHLTLPTTERV